MHQDPPNWAVQVLKNPSITDADIDFVESQLELRPFDESRLRFLRRLSSVDVSASPGSGKTTLAVAKILILERKWRLNSRGMLLLSHTNVAKNEIFNGFSRIGREITSNGRPHYIGTIHSFVIHFLAAPFLRSLGFSPVVYDDSITHRYRLRLYHHEAKRLKAIINKHSNNDSFQRNKNLRSALTVVSGVREQLLGEKLLGSIGPQANSYKEANGILLKSLKRGYLKYNEVFPFAKAYIEENNAIQSLIQQRFPFVLIDEMQDSSPEQVEIMHMLFPAASKDTTIQRIGDPNQAIYDFEQSHPSKSPIALDGKFPGSGYLTIPDSHRITPAIARAADAMASKPVKPKGLVGRHELEFPIPPIFIIFRRDQRHQVIPYFESLCRAKLPPHLLSTGKIAAVGGRAEAFGGAKPEQVPKVIGDYILDPPIYASPLKRDSEPALSEVIVSALDNLKRDNDLTTVINPIAAAILGFWNRNLRYPERIFIGHRPFRALKNFIEDASRGSESLSEALMTLIGGNIGAVEGRENFRAFICEVHSLTAKYFPNAQNRAKFFTLPVRNEAKDPAGPIRTYKHKAQLDPPFIINVETIHAIKGETHLATLLLDTFHYQHQIQKLFNQLIGKTGEQKQIDTALAYVAMTRPTHLLAVAGVESSLGATEEQITNAANDLTSKGWEVIRIEN